MEEINQKVNICLSVYRGCEGTSSYKYDLCDAACNAIKTNGSFKGVAIEVGFFGLDE